MKGRLRIAAEKRNELEDRLKEEKRESGCRLIRLNNSLLKQFHMDKVSCEVIEQSDKVFDGFVIRLGGSLVNSLCTGSEKAYSDNMMKCFAALSHVRSWYYQRGLPIR